MLRLVLRVLLVLQVLGAGDLLVPAPRAAAHRCCCGDSEQAASCEGACECACGAALAGAAEAPDARSAETADACSLARGTCGRSPGAALPSAREPFEPCARFDPPAVPLVRLPPPAALPSPAPVPSAPALPPPRT